MSSDAGQVGSSAFPFVEKPTVSMIVLEHNRPDLTKRCLESIVQNTPSLYEVIVVDNGSGPASGKMLAEFSGITVLRQEKNLGFGGGCNAGAAAARGHYVLFLNNDTIVTPGWLEALLDAAATPGCGAVGAKLVLEDGRLQEAGCIIWADGSALGYGRGDVPSASLYAHRRQVDFCSGACLMVPADLFREIGGFDERYHPGYYEDVDLCFAIRSKGYFILYEPEAVVIHREHGTYAHEDARALMTERKNIFAEKWAHALAGCKPYHSRSAIYACDTRTGPRVLFMDDAIPSVRRGMGQPRAFAMLQSLVKSGYVVTALSLTDHFFPQEETTLLRRQGVEVAAGHEGSLAAWLQQRRQYYDVVIVSRPHNLRKMRKLIAAHQHGAKVVYDAEAFFSERQERRAIVYGSLPKWLKARWQKVQERRLLHSADAVLAVSQREAGAFAQTIPQDRIHVWGHPIVVRQDAPEAHERSDILFVGGGLRPGYPNEDAICWFMEEVLPFIQMETPCRLLVAGVVESAAIQRYASSSVILLGKVQDLQPLYDSARVFIAPTRFAAGLPWKVQEAMSNGLPTVVTPLLYEQLGSPEGATIAADNASDFAHAVRQMLQDDALWQSVQRAALDYIQKDCNPDRMREELDSLLRSLLSGK